MQNQLLEQLKNLELAMFRLGLWSQTAPTPERLQSREPFCIDTLDFSEWLQWVFIPKLQEVIEVGQFHGLPNQSNIAGMGEEVYKERSEELREILVILQEIDKLLNSFTVQTLQ